MALNYQMLSKVTNEIYDVNLFKIDNNGYGFSHDSLQKILESKLTQIADWNITPITASENYCAVSCTITHKKGIKKVCIIGDINVKDAIFADSEQQKYTRSHPLAVATQNAIDTAVREFLEWPRIISKNDVEKQMNVYNDVNDENDENDYNPFANNSISNEEFEALCNKKPERGKYSDMTYAEIWESNPHWFEYIAKNNNPAYDDAKKFRALMMQREKEGK